jgi:hypothetical protein
MRPLLEHPVKTIVEYTDQKSPINQYPSRLVSPPAASPCCFSGMEEVGSPREDERWVFQYRRCRACGFVVRVILRVIPNPKLAKELRAILARSMARGVSF